MLTVDTIPLEDTPETSRRQTVYPKILLCFFVTSVTTASPTKLIKLEPLWRGLFVFGCHVVTTFAFRALKHNIIPRHNRPLILDFSRIDDLNCRSNLLNDISDGASTDRAATFPNRKPQPLL